MQLHYGSVVEPRSLGTASRCSLWSPLPTPRWLFLALTVVSCLSRQSFPVLAHARRRCLSGAKGRWPRMVGVGLGAALCAVPVVEVTYQG